ncbi:MAG TPA: hypothetical protein VE010_09695 [Thermoanaerobaculia bacterium]|nr:hypothetical protein [Thermoanaerobaculia bacterium]
MIRNRAFTIAAAVLLALTLGAHVYSAIALAGRDPHLDETEYVHAGWLMANGERLYETFFEHHSPLFLGTLAALAPAEERVDVRPYFVRARIVVSAFGGIALASLAFVLWRAAPEAAAIAIALLFGSGSMWLSGFAEVRAEAFALAFLLGGLALIVASRGAIGGLGVGFAVIACLWNPKWPIVSLAIGVVWLVRTEKRVAPFIAALITSVAGFAAIRAFVPFDLWWFFNYDVNLALGGVVGNRPETLARYFRGGIPFLYVPAAFRPALIVPAAMIVLASLRIDRSFARAVPLILLGAAFLELRFVYAWPAIFPYYYLMWSIAAAATLAVLPASIAALLRSTRIARPVFLATAAGMIVVTGAHAVAMIPARDDGGIYWRAQRELVSRMRPNDVVWLEPHRHPVSVRDAHYYWFAIYQHAAIARTLRESERGRRFLPPFNDVPTCAPPPNLRFTLDSTRPLPQTRECMQRLFASGRVLRVLGAVDVYELRLLESAAQSSR